MSKRVAMFVFNKCVNDSRVFKESHTLINAGYIVDVYALAADNLPVSENIKGLTINRVYVVPFYKRFFNKLSKISSTNTLSRSSSQNSNRKNIFELPKKVTRYLFLKLFKLFKKVIRYLFLKLFMPVNRPLAYFDFYKKVKDAILKNNKQYDIFHAHDMNTLYAAFKMAKLQNGKLVYDSHELYVDRNKPMKPSALYKFLSYRFENYFSKKADAVITVGDKIASILKQRYKLKHVEVILNAPQLNVIPDHANVNNIRHDLTIPNDKKLLIYSGSITFNRGLENLIRSLNYLPNCYLVLMGFGKESFKQKLLSIAQKEGVGNRFSFYGPVKSDEVIFYTAQADLGIAPVINACLSYYFCAPNKIFEYMLGGIPVISSNFPEMEKVITENKIGYTFDPEDPKSIADAVKNVFKDEQQYHLMKQNSKMASNKYNWENESKKILALYNSL